MLAGSDDEHPTNVKAARPAGINPLFNPISSVVCPPYVKAALRMDTLLELVTSSRKQFSCTPSFGV
jgi:hypothetical protein